jgi:hypothetical protein
VAFESAEKQHWNTRSCCDGAAQGHVLLLVSQITTKELFEYHTYVPQVKKALKNLSDEMLILN